MEIKSVKHNKNKLWWIRLWWNGLGTILLGSVFVSGYPLAVQAGGTLPLSDLEGLIVQSPELQQTVNQMLKKLNRTADQITCFGGRVGRQFGALGGARFAPFECYFRETKILQIEAKNWVILPDGTRFLLEELLNLEDLPPEMSLSFELESWQWQEEVR